MPSLADDHFKEEVRARTDLVSLIGESGITLQPQRGGKEYVGLCPFHNDHNPSLRVYPERQSYKCWSCGEGGDCFSFVMKRESIGFRETLEMLAARAHLELPKKYRAGPGEAGENKNRLYEIVAWAESEFHEFLLKGPAAERARTYLRERGITSPSISRFRLGYHPDNWEWLIERARGKYTAEQLAMVKLTGQRDGGNGFYDYFVDRVMFPIRDTQKRPVAFGGRVLPDSKQTGMGKYWNSPESVLFQKSRLLFALDHARESISKSGAVVVVEGYTDCIMAHQHGLTNFVATLGTSLNESHVMNLKRLAHRVVLVFDGDDPGKLAAEKALPRFLAHEVDLRILTLPDNLDPADFLAQRGKDALIAILDSSVEAWEQKFRLSMERHGMDSIDSRHRVLNDMLEVLGQVPGTAGTGLAGSWQMRENVILGRLAQQLKISEGHIRERMAELRTAQQQKTGTKPAFAGADVAFESPHAETKRPVAAPSRDELAERELLEIIFTVPEKAELIRSEIAPTDLALPQLRTLLELCYELVDEGVLPGYAQVTSRLEDAALKNVAAEIDLVAREKGVSAELVAHTLGYFRNKREGLEVAAALYGPHGTGPYGTSPADGLDESARERLRQATALHRKRVSRTTLN